LREENVSQLLNIAINKPRGTKPTAEPGWAKSSHFKHHLKREEHGKRGCEDVGKTQLAQTPVVREVLICLPRPSQCVWPLVLASE